MKNFFKIFIHSICYFLRGLSYLIPRAKNKWVVGNSRGFNNNTKYFFIHAKVNLKKEKCYWISKNNESRKLVRAVGFKAYHPWSIIGLYHLLTAKIYIYDVRPSALNYWVSGGAKFVNLWHGVGIKYIEFAGNVHPFPKESLINRLKSPIIYQKPDLFLSTSPLMTQHFCKCFRISPDKCIESSYPRCEIFNFSEEQCLNFIQTYEPQESLLLVNRLKLAAKSYIYMPTWRNSKQNFFEISGINLSDLNNTLKEKNELFIIKLHPFTRINIDVSKYSNIVVMNNKLDIYPILPFTDVLITDYSSIYFDYILMKKKSVLLFPFDYQTYIQEDRDLAFDFDTYMPGYKVYNFNDLLEVIRENKILTNDKIAWVKEEFWHSPMPKNLYKTIQSL